MHFFMIHVEGLHVRHSSFIVCWTLNTRKVFSNASFYAKSSLDINFELLHLFFFLFFVVWFMSYCRLMGIKLFEPFAKPFFFCCCFVRRFWDFFIVTDSYCLLLLLQRPFTSYHFTSLYLRWLMMTSFVDKVWCKLSRIFAFCSHFWRFSSSKLLIFWQLIENHWPFHSYQLTAKIRKQLLFLAFTQLAVPYEYQSI